MRHPPCYPVSCETSSSDIIIINLLKAVCRSRASKRKFCKAEQDCFGAPGTGWDFSQNWGFYGFTGYNVNVSDDQRPEFRSEFNIRRVWKYQRGNQNIIIFMHKLKIVEKKKKKSNKKIKIKRLWPFKDSQAPSWLSRPRTDVPTELPCHSPCVEICVLFSTHYILTNIRSNVKVNVMIRINIKNQIRNAVYDPKCYIELSPLNISLDE